MSQSTAQKPQVQTPTVVVSADAPDALSKTPSRESLTDANRNPAISRLRPGPKDTLPLKPPRKQRSSRFVVTEKVEIEHLAPFMGQSLLLSQTRVDQYLAETPPTERPQLFIKKLNQCRVVFDFNDPSAELQGKQIKAQTLHEMLEYITTQRGVITEAIYPEVVKMVRVCSFN